MCTCSMSLQTYAIKNINLTWFLVHCTWCNLSPKQKRKSLFQWILLSLKDSIFSEVARGCDARARDKNSAPYLGGGGTSKKLPPTSWNYSLLRQRTCLILSLRFFECGARGRVQISLPSPSYVTELFWKLLCPARALPCIKKYETLHK